MKSTVISYNEWKHNVESNLALDDEVTDCNCRGTGKIPCDRCEGYGNNECQCCGAVSECPDCEGFENTLEALKFLHANNLITNRFTNDVIRTVNNFEFSDYENQKSNMNKRIFDLIK